MDAVQEFLEVLKQQGLDRGAFLGLLNILIGRRIQKATGEPISKGLTWRELSALLKKTRWDKDAAREVGLDPDQLPARDRQRYWYTVIAQARVDSAQATQAGDQLAQTLQGVGFMVGPAPKR